MFDIRARLLRSGNKELANLVGSTLLKITSLKLSSPQVNGCLQYLSKFVGSEPTEDARKLYRDLAQSVGLDPELTPSNFIRLSVWLHHEDETNPGFTRDLARRMFGPKTTHPNPTLPTKTGFAKGRPGTKTQTKS